MAEVVVYGVALLVGLVVFVRWLWRDSPPLWMPDEPTTKVEPRRVTVPETERVLFVCTHNSARSQMAEALLRHVTGFRFHVASGGTAPTRVHPLAERVMDERGLTLAAHRAKSLADVGTAWDYVITVCDTAYEQCPDFPAKTSRLHWSVEDPSRATGSEAEQLAAFRRVRDELAERISRWLADRPEK